MPRLFDIHIDEVSGVDRPANRRKFLVVKHAKKDDMDNVTAEDIAKLPENIRKLITDLTEKAEKDKDADENRSLVAKFKAWFTKDVPEPDDVVKNADPETQKVYAAMKKLAEGAEATAKTAVEKLERNEMIIIAKELKHLGKVDDVAGELVVLKANADETTWANYLKRQRGIAKQLKDSVLFKEMGDGDVGGDTGEAKIEAIAKTIQKANPDLTKEAAYLKALSTDEGKAAYKDHTKKGDR